MLYIELRKVYGVWQVDLRMPCPEQRDRVGRGAYIHG